MLFGVRDRVSTNDILVQITEEVVSKGLLITLDGLAGIGKTTLGNLLERGLGDGCSRTIHRMQDVPDAALVNFRTLTGDMSAQQALMLEHEHNVIAHNCAIARGRASAGDIVLLERHMCTASALWCMQYQHDADHPIPYLAELDHMYGEPDLAIVLVMHDVAKLQERLMRANQRQYIRLPRSIMHRARRDLERYVPHGPRSAEMPRRIGVSAEGGPEKTCGRVWEALNQQYPHLIPDDVA